MLSNLCKIQNIKIPISPFSFIYPICKSDVFFLVVNWAVYHHFNLLKFLLPLLFYFNKLFFHKDFHLIFHLLNVSFKFDDFLFHSVLPSKIGYGGFIFIILNQGKDFILQFFDFSHHFLFPLITNFSSLRNDISGIIFAICLSSLIGMRKIFLRYFSYFSFYVICRVSISNWIALIQLLIFALVH